MAPQDNRTNISHEAEKNLRNQVQRDAARVREQSYDTGMELEKDAEKAEAELESGRLHDAF